MSCDDASQQPTNPPSRSTIRQSCITLLFCAFAAAAPAQDLPNLSSTIVRGSSIYSPSELFDVYREELGKPITAARARAIVERLAERYDRDGYSRPSIKVDDDLVAVGVLRLDVLEPRIAGVEINGNPGPYRSRLEALSERLTRDGPLERGELAALVQRLRALGGLSLTASTTANVDDPGRHRLVLDTDYAPLGGVVQLTNRGTDEIGPTFVLGQVQTHGLFAGSTDLGLQFGAAADYEEYHGVGLSVDTALGSAGSRLRATAFRSRSDPLESGVDREDHYLRDRATVTASVPVAADGRTTASVSVGLAYDDLWIDRGGVLLRDERLRVLEIAWRGLWRSSDAVQSAATLELAQGLGGLGSRLVTADLADDPRDRDFSIGLATFTRLVQLDGRWTTRIDAFAQFTNDVLPYLERFKIGGDRLGRGFEIAAIAGDRGLGAKVELRRSLGWPAFTLERAFAYGFYDLGATWKNDVPGRESAATGGVGIGFHGGRVVGHLELAKPLTHPDVEGRRDTAAFLDLTVQF